MRTTKGGPVRFAQAGLNLAGAQHCAQLVAAGAVDKSSEWSFGEADSAKLLGDKDWPNYEKWFLGDHYKYPIGKDGKVFRSALVAIRMQAARKGDDVLFAAAGLQLDGIDGTKCYTGAKALDMRQKAWAKFEMKGFTETDTHYVFSGIASTPSPDRMQDIVEPMGADYDLPMPLLWQHDGCSPIGEVFEATPKASGIPVTMRIPKLDTPGTLKDRLDEAVQSISLKLVRGLSIGFAPIEYSYMEDTGGYRFIKWLWLELSAVTIPANAEATITSIKSFDAKSLPASRHKRVSIDLKAGVTAQPEEADQPTFHINVRRSK